MFRSMKGRFRSLDGRFGSIYRRFRSMSRRFRSMNRRFQLTCLRCTLKIHHNNEYWETKGTLSLRRNHYGSHFLPFLARRNHFGGGNFYGVTGLCQLLLNFTNTQRPRDVTPETSTCAYTMNVLQGTHIPFLMTPSHHMHYLKKPPLALVGYVCVSIS